MEASSDKKYEEYSYVLDYLSLGKPGRGKTGFKAEPLVQLLGENYFTLLEAEAVRGAKFELREKVYVGKARPRDKINHIISRVNYEELTSTAKSELPFMVEMIVNNREWTTVQFFNKAQPVTPRMHALELLPGIGKKYMWSILEQREKKPFESFEDIKKRAVIPDPAKIVCKRILDELTGEAKHRVFIRSI
jgi:putative nucleotide binding protein